jgi:hypothetical protein
MYPDLMDSPNMRNRKIIRQAIELLGLKAKVKIIVLPGFVMSDGEPCGGYYDTAWDDNAGQYHHITVTAMHGAAVHLTLHELIHAWQAENLQWKYGHGADFKTMCVILGAELGIDWKTIYTY